MSTHVLIMGRTNAVLYEVADHLDTTGFELHSAITLAEVEEIMADHKMAAAIMGAGLDLGLRLQIIEAIFSASTSTTIHMKDWDSGPTGMLPFVANVLNGLRRE